MLFPDRLTIDFLFIYTHTHIQRHYKMFIKVAYKTSQKPNKKEKISGKDSFIRCLVSTSAYYFRHSEK